MVVPYAALEKREALYIKSFHKRSCLINSFWGLDPAESVPPNFVHTGPLSRPAETLMEDFKTKDNDLFEWMNKALEDKQPVVLITIGSECKWQQWSVDAMHQGLKKIGCKVIWGLKGFKNPAEGDDNFRVMEWLPQIEILAHPALKAGLTHCGFGGTLEYISMGVPIVAWPHMIDQPDNAMLLVDAGAAVILCNKLRMSDKIEDTLTYKKQEFDGEKVYEVFNEVLTNPKYKQGIDRLKIQSMTFGGYELAVKTVENTYITNGVDHLSDKELTKRQQGFSCCRMYCCILFWVAVLIVLVIHFIIFFTEYQELKEKSD